jgi:hypothetical protein
MVMRPRQMVRKLHHRPLLTFIHGTNRMLYIDSSSSGAIGYMVRVGNVHTMRAHVEDDFEGFMK